MKIAFLGPAPPYRGGISLFASHFANEMSRQGHDVCFFNFRKQYPQLLFPAGKQEDDTSTTHPNQRILIPYLPHTWDKTAKAINTYKPDLTIVSWWLPFFAPAYGYILGKLNHGGKVILAHNITPHEDWIASRSLLRYVFSKADEIVVLSKSCLLDLKRNRPSQIVRKAKLGFHPIYDTYSGITEKVNVLPSILFYGMIKSYKGLDVLLEAMPIIRVAIPDIRLVIAGTVYKDKAAYEEKIKLLDLSANVETHFRYISDKEVATFFRQSDLCILPYKSATQSGVIATAYSYDTPVVASDVGGLSEYVEHGLTGLLVPPGNPSSLAAAIISFYSKDMKAPMQEGIRRFKEKNTWSELVKLIFA
ncbi:MAG: glycosyltransferase family 4 protein [Candidatus Cloacimonetes bacterium]|nr:glycosyltransferase family 4 protein [Candidatus Cloacimonadota bacterium]